ncbi:DUF1365 family protein [Streptomyces sp. NPDC054804]
MLGHVFNPLTLYWRQGRPGEPRCAVAEVPNTYGGRHCPLLRPDASGTARTAKEFCVSPYFPEAGPGNAADPPGSATAPATAGPPGRPAWRVPRRTALR